MPRVPVRVGAGRLQPDVASSFPWRCVEHLEAGKRACKTCCGSCYWLAPGEGCALGSMKPMRCKTYPLVPLEDGVIIDNRCPDHQHFIEKLTARDPSALALLEVAKAMSDMRFKGAHDQSEELKWLMEYTSDGFGGPYVWSRGRLHDEASSRRITRAARSAAPKRRMP